MEISDEPAVSALGITAHRDVRGQLIVAVGDIHNPRRFPDSHRHKEQSQRGAFDCAYHSISASPAASQRVIQPGVMMVS